METQGFFSFRNRKDDEDKMSKKISDKNENYLDKIPYYIEGLRWEQDEKGQVTLYQENKGFFNRIAQKCFHRPKVSQIHLDSMGNFVWPLIDGSRNIYEIAQQVQAQFGEQANPLYERLIQYLNMLKEYGFINIK